MSKHRRSVYPNITINTLYTAAAYLSDYLPYMIYKDIDAYMSISEHGNRFWQDFDHKLDRRNGPAFIEWRDEDGKLMLIEKWFRHGKLHNAIAPADIAYLDGEKISEHWLQWNKLHRIGGPAIIEASDYPYPHKLEAWYIDDNLHNTAGASRITYYSNGVIKEKEWHKNGYYDEGAILQ